MGKQSLLGFIMGSGHASNSGTMHGEAKLAAQKFDQDEIHVLRKTWQDLADRSSGKGVDKDTFLQYFPLNGLLGERLFAQFDTKKTGSIDFDEFILGLATVCRLVNTTLISFNASSLLNKPTLFFVFCVEDRLMTKFTLSLTCTMSPTTTLCQNKI